VDVDPPQARLIQRRRQVLQQDSVGRQGEIVDTRNALKGIQSKKIVRL